MIIIVIVIIHSPVAFFLLSLTLLYIVMSQMSHFKVSDVMFAFYFGCALVMHRIVSGSIKCLTYYRKAEKLIIITRDDE